VVDNCVFENNGNPSAAGLAGPAITATDISVVNSRFTNNNPGTINSQGTLVAENSLFTRNQGNPLIISSNLVITNCTFEGNLSPRLVSKSTSKEHKGVVIRSSRFLGNSIQQYLLDMDVLLKDSIFQFDTGVVMDTSEAYAASNFAIVHFKKMEVRTSLSRSKAMVSLVFFFCRLFRSYIS